MSFNNDWFDETMAKTLIESGIDIEIVESLEGKIYNAIMNSLPKTTEILLKSLKENSAEMLEEHRLFRQEFEARLLRKWAKPLNLLEMLIVISIEIGEKISQKYKQEAEIKNDFVFEVLIRIHSRACQIAYEILCLLRGGFADGAFARWRTLHELSVLSNFISEQSNETAKRYIDYEIIENYYEMVEYQQYCSRLNYEPISQEEIDTLEKERNKLISLYGEEFSKPYGWAADTLPKNKRNFKGLEEETNLDHLRPYYKLSCNNIHLGPKGTNYSLGLIGDFRRSDLLPCGASNYGLADPGQNTSISLTQITSVLITINTNYERIMGISSMIKLNDEICDCFCDTQKKIEEEELQGE